MVRTVDVTPGNDLGGSDFGYLELTLEAFLEAIAARKPAPGGGATAAAAVAMAAGLGGMAARFAGEQPSHAPDLAVRADGLRRRVAPLAEADARAYAEVIAARALPREPDRATRHRAIRSSLSSAADIPLAVAEAGAEVALLASELAVEGNPNLRGDAVTAALLAEAGARAAAVLVKINLGDDDERIRRAEALATEASRAARAALDHGP